MPELVRKFSLHFRSAEDGCLVPIQTSTHSDTYIYSFGYIHFSDLLILIQTHQIHYLLILIQTSWGEREQG